MGFLPGLFHSRDKPTNSTNGSAYRFLFGGSNSGKAVNERSAMQMTAVYACVKILSESIAGLPVHVYKYTDSSSKEKAIKHPLYRLIIDKPAAAKLRQLYKNYLSGMSLSKAAEAGIPTYHGTAKRLMGTVHYLGDSFYPAIIDKETYQKAQEERKRRATKLGRNNKQTQMRAIQIPTSFHMGEVTALHDNPMKQAEYLYSLIESESQ